MALSLNDLTKNMDADAKAAYIKEIRSLARQYEKPKRERNVEKAFLKTKEKYNEYVRQMVTEKERLFELPENSYELLHKRGLVPRLEQRNLDDFQSRERISDATKHMKQMMTKSYNKSRFTNAKESFVRAIGLPEEQAEGIVNYDIARKLQNMTQEEWEDFNLTNPGLIGEAWETYHSETTLQAFSAEFWERKDKIMTDINEGIKKSKRKFKTKNPYKMAKLKYNQVKKRLNIQRMQRSQKIRRNLKKQHDLRLKLEAQEALLKDENFNKIVEEKVHKPAENPKYRHEAKAAKKASIRAALSDEGYTPISKFKQKIEKLRPKWKRARDKRSEIRLRLIEEMQTTRKKYRKTLKEGEVLKKQYDKKLAEEGKILSNAKSNLRKTAFRQAKGIAGKGLTALATVGVVSSMLTPIIEKMPHDLKLEFGKELYSQITEKANDTIQFKNAFGTIEGLITTLSKFSEPLSKEIDDRGGLGKVVSDAWEKNKPIINKKIHKGLEEGAMKFKEYTMPSGIKKGAKYVWEKLKELPEKWEKYKEERIYSTRGAGMARPTMIFRNVGNDVLNLATPPLLMFTRLGDVEAISEGVKSIRDLAGYYHEMDLYEQSNEFKSYVKQFKEQMNINSVKNARKIVQEEFNLSSNELKKILYK